MSFFHFPKEFLRSLLNDKIDELTIVQAGTKSVVTEELACEAVGLDVLKQEIRDGVFISEFRSSSARTSFICPIRVVTRARLMLGLISSGLRMYVEF